MRRAGVRRWTGLMLALGAVLALAGCRRAKVYSQDTPDDVIRSAVSMVKNGDARQLGSLIYADSPEMRLTLDRLGDLLGHMAALAQAVEKKFPQEMAELKRRAAEAAEQGKPDPLLGMLSNMGGNPNFGRAKKLGGDNAPEPPITDDGAEALFNRLFADPYGWLERNASRLSALKTTDDTASIMLDNQPIIPLVGLPMRREDGRWYIALPTNFPGISDAMPKSKEQWQILVSVIKVLDRTVVEMTQDVSTGRVATLDSLAKKAREKAVLPGVIAFAAYGREMDVHKRVDRRVKQFQARQKEWVKSRSGGGDEAGKGTVSPKLLAALNRLAAPKIEPLVRKNKAPNFESMSGADFEGTIASWLAEAGIKVKVDGDLSPAAVDPEVQRWEAAQPARKNIARVVTGSGPAKK